MGAVASRTTSAVAADAPPVARASAERWRDAVPLALVYAIATTALVGFAVFQIRPQLVAEVPGAAAFYSRAFSLFARVQILVAFGALVVVLVRHVGARWTAAFAALYVLSLASELLGTTVGLPFGPYHYTDALGAKWFGHVPLLIPLSWFFMAVPSYALAMRATPAPSRPGSSLLGARALLASVILLAWDLTLDPAMSRATAYWVWAQEGPYYGMPLLNLVGWYVTGLALMAALAWLRAEWWLRAVPPRWLAAFYAANLVLPIGLCAASGMWPPAFIGVAVIALAARLATRTPGRAVAAARAEAA